MTPEQLEAAVVEFLDRREQQPALTPETFAAEHPDSRRELLEAIESALEVERLFPSETGLAPRSIGPYRILEEIGRGGMGIVYRAERAGQDFALKLLPLAPILGPPMLERFRREAGTLAQLSHPHIVRVHDSGIHEEMPYLVMDYVAGRPLHESVGKLTIAEAAKLVEVLAEAIDAAHRQGVLHRDLKPHNVIVRPDGTPVVLDFGLSAREELPTLTATGDILGTPRYMAPEQLRAESVDARTDVYALGLILYELVVQRPAREEKGRDALLESVRHGTIPRPRSIRREIPIDVERILLTALARDPARRYTSAGLLAEDLARLRRGEPVTARPPGRMRETIERAPGAAATAVRAVFAGMRGTAADEGAPADRHRASHHVDRATALWIDGDTNGARQEISVARRLDPRDSTARVLAAHLLGSIESAATPSLRAAQEGLRLFADGEFTEAMAKVRSCVPGELRPSLAAAVVGLSASRTGDLPAAHDELSVAAHLLPTSSAVQRALGSVCDRLERYEEAVRAYRRAIELSPTSVEMWADLGEVLLHQRDIEEGLRVVAHAESLLPSGAEDRRLLRIRAGLEIHAGQQVEARRHLARLLELDPQDIEAKYRIAYSLDLDHDMTEAERVYCQVLEMKPDHVEALLCLANLHSGASRGQCRSCDEFFAAHPASLDLDKAEHYLLRCLDADRGRNQWVTTSARDITLRLQRRGAVIELLERLIATRDGSSAVIRLEDVLRRLRLVSG